MELLERVLSCAVWPRAVHAAAQLIESALFVKLKPRMSRALCKKFKENAHDLKLNPFLNSNWKKNHIEEKT